MRISALKDSAYYAPDLISLVEVFLDGEKCPLCVEVYEEAGCLWEYEHDEQDKIVPYWDKEKNSLRPHVVQRYGKIEVRLRA